MYGTPWCIDSQSFSTLSSILKDIRGGLVMENGAEKLNSISLYDFKNENIIISERWDLKNNESFDGIGVINLNGPITKGGGKSSNGTVQLANNMFMMAQDSRIKGFIIKADSGGGSASAMQVMVDAINEVKKTMPVYALIDKGGTAASACYGIISACTGIYSEDGMSIVGSVGTMIQLKATPHGNVDSDGNKTIILYASKSTKKNKPLNEAIEKDNYELIIDELLNPINDNFINNVVSNRPMLEGTKFDDGHTVFSKDAIGTFIDGIASFNEVVNMILSDTNKGISNNINTNSNTMTKEEFKAVNPNGYAEILSEGIAQEKERVDTWSVFAEVAPYAVLAGIKSGLSMKESERTSFLLESAKANAVASLLGDNIKSIVTKQTETSETEESVEQKEFNGLIKEIKLT